jgi:hypothetical protein
MMHLIGLVSVSDRREFFLTNKLFAIQLTLGALIGLLIEI